jgi:hypothetical protein
MARGDFRRTLNRRMARLFEQISGEVLAELFNGRVCKLLLYWSPEDNRLHLDLMGKSAPKASASRPSRRFAHRQPRQLDPAILL